MLAFLRTKIELVVRSVSSAFNLGGGGVVLILKNSILINCSCKTHHLVKVGFLKSILAKIKCYKPTYVREPTYTYWASNYSSRSIEQAHAAVGRVRGLQMLLYLAERTGSNPIHPLLFISFYLDVWTCSLTLCDSPPKQNICPWSWGQGEQREKNISNFK